MENQLNKGRIGNICYERQDPTADMIKAIIRSPVIDEKGHEIGFGVVLAKIECSKADLPMYASADAMQQEILDTRHELKRLTKLLPKDSEIGTIMLKRFRNLGRIYHQSKGDLNPGLNRWERLNPYKSEDTTE